MMGDIDIGKLTLPELTALLHLVADEIQLRMMEQAGQEAMPMYPDGNPALMICGP